MTQKEYNDLDSVQESLFSNTGTKIDVVKLHFDGAETLEWRDLFFWI